VFGRAAQVFGFVPSRIENILMPESERGRVKTMRFQLPPEDMPLEKDDRLAVRQEAGPVGFHLVNGFQGRRFNAGPLGLGSYLVIGEGFAHASASFPLSLARSARRVSAKASSSASLSWSAWATA